MTLLRYVCGIDPGLTGAVCMLNIDSGHAWLHDMPVTAKAIGSGNQLNAQGFADILAGYTSASVLRVFVEAVHALPKQGVTSMFGFGRTAGVIDGVLAALRLPMVHVRPEAWKRSLKLLKTDKDAARTVAINLYPHLSSDLSRKRDIGRADALLIAHYGMESLMDLREPSRYALDHCS